MTKKNEVVIGIGLIFLEVSLLFALFSFIPSNVIAGIGNPNTTVITLLEIGNVYPDVIYVDIDGGAASVTLTPNDTTTVTCTGVVRDYNGDADVTSANATLYGLTSSSFGDSNDNNYHYQNTSCELIADTGDYAGFTDDPYHSLANCTFEVEYYANPETWVCNITANDTMYWTDTNESTIIISQLLALGLPDTINYGRVNATFVSNENVTNITNYGNVEINISLEGYGVTQGDGLAMNCTLGNIGTIDIMYEKYNLSTTTAGDISLSVFESTYTNLSTTPEIKEFNLNYRTNDTVNKAINASYWRIYVPIGVAGTCNGSIIFGATTAAGS